MESPSIIRRPDEQLRPQIEKAVGLLAKGGVVSLPTDTLYGLAAAATHPEAVERVFRIKRRPADMALPILLADSSEISRYAEEVPELARRLVEQFYPGPLTMVLRHNGSLPSSVTGGESTIALRIPNHCVPRAIVRALGTAITGTSANHSGMPGLTTASAVRKQLGADVDLVIDGGECKVGVASTVIDLSQPEAMILREGVISKQQIEEACGVSIGAKS